MKGRNTRKMISIIALGISLMLLIVFVAPAGMMSQVYATEDRKENEEEKSNWTYDGGSNGSFPGSLRRGWEQQQ